LLVTALVTAVVGDGLGRVAALGDVLSEVALADGSPAERRDVRVVGANRARGPALASKAARVLAEVTRVKLLERRHDVFMISKKVDEASEFPTRVLAVVPALATLAFSPCPSENLRRPLRSAPRYAPPWRSVDRSPLLGRVTSVLG